MSPTHYSTYVTRDLGLAAALVTIGYKVLELAPFNDIGAFSFVTDLPFAKGKELETEYYKMRLMVPAKAYANEVRSLRARVQDEHRRQEDTRNGS